MWHNLFKFPVHVLVALFLTYCGSIVTNPALRLRDESMALAKQGEDEQAIDLYLKGIDFDHKQASLYFQFGTSYFGLGKHEEADGALSKALALEPLLVDTWNIRGQVLVAMDGDLDALEQYDLANRLFKES